MANINVYPFGTEGTLPAGYPIINDLLTGGADKALSAEQGKVLGEMLMDDMPIDLDDYPRISYAIDANRKWNDDSGFACVIIPIASVKFVRCTADGGICQFAFLKTNGITVGATPDFADGTEKILLQDGDTETYTVPGDANYLYVYTHTTTTDITERYKDLTFLSSALENLGGERTIFPLFTYDIIRNSNGEFGTNTNFTNKHTLSTVRYIKNSKNFSIKVGAACTLYVFHYGADFSYLGYSTVSVTADTDTVVPLPYECSYIKLSLYDENLMVRTTAELTGYFPDDWDTFNPRSSDSGYHRISVLVDVTNPTCCDEETQTVQDTENLLPDYGVICLPMQYRNTGKPTRIIFYCHGAAVNYSGDVTRFNSVDLDPTYWLAEGYAVMDIEGNPFNNTDEHLQIPQAMDCFVAAYQWAIEHYNLCRDGIFLGGRSMGGGSVFTIMRKQCPIPVIAACPNVPSTLAPGASSATRKAFWAEHCGFDVPTGYSFGNNTYTNNDKALFLANWDKLIKANPAMSLVTDLGTSDEYKQSFINCYESYSNERVAMWEALHMVARCPVKFFGCNQDETCPPEYTSELYYRMLLNAAQITELRLFNSYKDYTGTGTSAHHYDTQDPALRADITTSYGEELEDVPIVYIEMLAFWRRYEQGL